MLPFSSPDMRSRTCKAVFISGTNPEFQHGVGRRAAECSLGRRPLRSAKTMRRLRFSVPEETGTWAGCHAHAKAMVSLKGEPGQTLYERAVKVTLFHIVGLEPLGLSP